MFERLAYIPQFHETYEYELGQIESASERLAERLERERAALIRSDGSPKYAPAEMAEREVAILEAAGAEFDRLTARSAAKAKQDAADLQKRIALLERDPFDALKPEEQAKAATRREFVREDVERLPAHQLVPLIRAALASGDKAIIYLFHRYLGQRIEAQRGHPAARADPELLTLSRELGAVFGADHRAARRRDLEAKLRAATSFPIAVSTARREADGSDARDLTRFRQHIMARF